MASISGASTSGVSNNPGPFAHAKNPTIAGCRLSRLVIAAHLDAQHGSITFGLGHWDIATSR